MVQAWRPENQSEGCTMQQKFFQVGGHSVVASKSRAQGVTWELDGVHWQFNQASDHQLYSQVGTEARTMHGRFSDFNQAAAYSCGFAAGVNRMAEIFDQCPEDCAQKSAAATSLTQLGEG